jgi:hypothetical protein
MCRSPPNFCLRHQAVMSLTKELVWASIERHRLETETGDGLIADQQG